MSYSANLVGIHPLCERCFRSADAPGTGSPVVMSRNDPSVLHRLCDGKEQSEPVESHPTHRFPDAVHDTDGPVDALAALRKGDGVVWQTPQIPLEVVGVSEVRLRGPRGGEYTLRRAETADEAYAIYPGIGVTADVRRVVTADDRPERV